MCQGQSILQPLVEKVSSLDDILATFASPASTWSPRYVWAVCCLSSPWVLAGRWALVRGPVTPISLFDVVWTAHDTPLSPHQSVNSVLLAGASYRPFIHWEVKVGTKWRKYKRACALI